MTLDYGTRPELLEAVIGPGISQEAFEVGDEVYDAFREAGFPMSEIARKQENGILTYGLPTICNWKTAG